MPRPLDILIVGHNYAPEPVGIGPCTTGMAEMLAARGHRVRMITGTPYYPQWKVVNDDPPGRKRHSHENGVAVTRLPHYVPAVPHGWMRILHHLSFAVLALGALIRACVRRRPDVILAVAPSILSTAVARAVASAIRRPFWVHVQDLEMEMALATGNLPHIRLRACLFGAIERFALSGDRISSISAAMCDRLAAKKGVRGRIVEFRNWARPDIDARPEPSLYRVEWGLGCRHMALYSGNLAAKQGIEIIIAAARLLAHRSDILFVVCGNGPNRAMLERSAAGCPTIAFFDLQPAERLSDLLATATVHLLPQIAGAADLVLPSKLPNMLASGRPVVATAERATGLWQEVEGCGIVTRPHDAVAFAGAIARLIDDAPLRDELGVAARVRAAERWSKDAILGGFERDLRGLVADRQRDRAWRRGIAQPLAQQERASNVEVAQG